MFLIGKRISFTVVYFLTSGFYYCIEIILLFFHVSFELMFAFYNNNFLKKENLNNLNKILPVVLAVSLKSLYAFYTLNTKFRVILYIVRNFILKEIQKKCQWLAPVLSLSSCRFSIFTNAHTSLGFPKTN